jgi:hypothetical protein
MGAHARLGAGSLSLIVEALTADGQACWRREGATGRVDLEGALALGRELGGQVREEAGDRLELG